MIQDITPHKLDNAFRNAEPRPTDKVFVFCEGKVLASIDEEGMELPDMSSIASLFEQVQKYAVYAFSVDDKPIFLMLQDGNADKELPAGMEYIELRKLNDAKEDWLAFAAVTASHLNHWYGEHRFCGSCGSRLELSDTERATVCPQCGNVQYPRISPVIMAAVTDGDRLLVTRYAGREYKGLALIAGFVEIGESLEGALEREVMEEVGLRVKDISYFGRQPWGFSDSVISGFFVKLDGKDNIYLDENELSEAVWLSRDEIPPQDSDISITAAMIEAFRKGVKV